MKHFLSSFAFLLLSQFIFCQDAEVSGNVTDNYGNPLMGVNVLVKNTIKGTQTDEQGAFAIRGLAQGDYVLSLSYLGFKTREVPFSIAGDREVDLAEIILYEGNEILSEVIPWKGSGATSSRERRPPMCQKCP